MRIVSHFVMLSVDNSPLLLIIGTLLEEQWSVARTQNSKEKPFY